MTRALFRCTRLLPALALLLGSASAGAAGLEVGARAPEFTLQGVDGALYSLAEHRNKRGVVVAWFPKAFTPG